MLSSTQIDYQKLQKIASNILLDKVVQGNCDCGNSWTVGPYRSAVSSTEKFAVLAQRKHCFCLLHDIITDDAFFVALVFCQITNQ